MQGKLLERFPKSQLNLKISASTGTPGGCSAGDPIKTTYG